MVGAGLWVHGGDAQKSGGPRRLREGKGCRRADTHREALRKPLPGRLRAAGGVLQFPACRPVGAALTFLAAHANFYVLCAGNWLGVDTHADWVLGRQQPLLN